MGELNLVEGIDVMMRTEVSRVNQTRSGSKSELAPMSIEDRLGLIGSSQHSIRRS